MSLRTLLRGKRSDLADELARAAEVMPTPAPVRQKPKYIHARTPVRTHRIGWEEITDLAKAWHAMRSGDVQHAMRTVEAVLDGIDGRWRSV